MTSDVDTCPSSRSACDPIGDHLLVTWRCARCTIELPVDPRFPVAKLCGRCREEERDG